jgi:hypothetical protein
MCSKIITNCKDSNRMVNLCFVSALCQTDAIICASRWYLGYNTIITVDIGKPLFKVISERPVILTSEWRALGEGAITTYFKRLRFDAAGGSGARTHDLPDAEQKLYH